MKIFSIGKPQPAVRTRLVYPVFKVFWIMLLGITVFACKHPANTDSSQKDGYTYYPITIDGVDQDWENIGFIAESEGQITNISGYLGQDKLYLLARGTNFNGVATCWYLDTDLNTQSGFTEHGGSDFYIQIDNLTRHIYRYTGSGSDWSWTQEGEVEFCRTDTLEEAGIAYSRLNISGQTSVKIGFELAYSDRLPVLGSLATLTFPPPGPMSIPNAVGMAIDDTGWITWRQGNSRDETLIDYQTIVNVGQNVHTRIMTALILQNFDKAGICAKAVYNLPLAPSDMTEYGTSWNNPVLALPEVADNYPDEVCSLYLINSAYIELGVHGVSHEHYPPAPTSPPVTYERAEFARIYPWPDIGHADPWGVTDNTNKLLCYDELLRQFIGEAQHSFPKAMVPPAHAWFYGADGKGDPASTGFVANQFGIKYMIADLSVSFFGEPAGVIDNGVLCMHRALGCNPVTEGATPWTGDWNEFETPYYPDDRFAWVEAHFPNYWGAEAAWTDYLKGLNKAGNRMLAKNTAQCASQWLYHQDTMVRGTDGKYTIDNTGMRNDAYTYDLLSTLTLKIPLNGKHLQSTSINNGAQLTGYWEDEYGYGYLMLGHETNPMGRLDKTVYTLNATLGTDYLTSYPDLKTATFNVFSYSYTATQARLVVEMYGRQTSKIKLPFTPNSVSSDNPDLVINTWDYNTGFIYIDLAGLDIQGETGAIIIQ